MSDLWVQEATGTGTGTAVATLNGVVAGNLIAVHAWCGNNLAPSPFGVADAQGSYTQKGPSASDSTNNVFGRNFVLEAANSGTHTITLTAGGSDTLLIKAREVGTGGANPAYVDAVANFQNSPGTGAGAVTSGNLAVTVASTIVSMASDTASVSASDEPTAVSGTARDAGTSGVIGAYRSQSQAAASSAAGTFTAITGTHQFIDLAIAVLNAPAAASLPQCGRQVYVNP